MTFGAVFQIKNKLEIVAYFQGVTDKSAVTNVADLKQLVTEICLQFGGALVEQYIPGF